MRLNKIILLFLQTFCKQQVAIKTVLLSILFLSSIHAFSQEKVSFKAADGLSITADLYLLNEEKPFILLFHQAESSRGEYLEIAPKLLKLGYNCLAVDLRAGSKSNFVENETAQRAEEQSYTNTYLDAKQDILASIEFVKRYNHQPIILFGSSYSASLSLMIASENKRVSSVIAFSPGEYFRPEISVKDRISSLDVPLFIAASEFEYDNVKDITSLIASENIVLFKPSKGRGAHGAKALWTSSSSNSEYWLNLTQFFRRL